MTSLLNSIQNCRAPFSFTYCFKQILLSSSVVAVSFLGSFAQAYIPNSHTIIGRLVRNSGKGVYVIDQEVQFRTAGEPLTLREHWVVENGETMHLSVSAPQAAKLGLEPMRFEASYRDGRKTAPDLLVPPGTAIPVKTSALSPEFIEGLFNARSTSGFINALQHARVVPPGSLRERPHFTKLEQVKYAEEPYVRLGRTAGVVTWIFGDVTPVQTSAATQKLNPAAWIEQDAFLLRRVRFPTEAQVTADHFTSYPNSLRLARERTVSWANNSVLIRVLSVKHLAQAPREPSVQAKGTNLPDIAQVKEFYSRFR